MFRAVGSAGAPRLTQRVLPGGPACTAALYTTVWMDCCNCAPAYMLAAIWTRSELNLLRSVRETSL